MDQLEKPAMVSEKLFTNNTGMFTEFFVFALMG